MDDHTKVGISNLGYMVEHYAWQEIAASRLAPDIDLLCAAMLVDAMRESLWLAEASRENCQQR